MADFDFSILATLDSTSVTTGGAQTEEALKGIQTEERRSQQTTQESTRSTREAERAERERVQALNAVKAAIDPTFASQQRLNQMLADAQRFYESGEISLEQLTQAQRLYNQAVRGGATSAGAQRTAYTQLGFQIQDITQSLALGVNPLVVFGQQAGQTAFAVSNMGGVLGRVGGFLAGPFGSIILGAVTVLGFLATTASDVEESLNDAASAADSFGNAQDLLGQIVDLTTGKITEQNAVLREQIRLTAESNILAAQEAEREALDNLGDGEDVRGRAFVRGGGFANPGAAGDPFAGVRDDGAFESAQALREQSEEFANLIDAFREGDATFEETIARTRELGEEGRVAGDNLLELQQRIVNVGRARTDQEANQLIIDRLNGEPLDARLRRPGRSNRGENNRRQRELERLADFGLRASERIQRINEQFDEQPNLLDRAARSTRELDNLIAQLAERQPPNFEDTIENARAAKEAIEESLIRPFDDLRRGAQERAQINELLLANRVDEAEALGLILRIEERLGPVTRERREEILRIVENERLLTEEFERRVEFTENYLSATQQARGEIEAILQGTGRLSNFGDIFKGLQARVLTEQIFGDVLRDLDEFVREETAIETSVDIMATQTERAGTAANDFADELIGATGRISRVARGGGEQSFEEAFADLGAPNRPTDQTSDDDENVIVVTGNQNSVNNLTPERYFDELTKTLVRPLIEGFDEILGTNLAPGLSDVIGGALAGGIAGGPLGAILGGLNELEGLPEGISEAIGGALQGTRTGTAVAGITDALGLPSSTTGAQIGGAIGSFIPIPGGEIIGSLAGSLLGGLIGGSRRGSATITSGDGPISLSGNSTSRQTAAQGLGGSVQEGLRRIADQLDADLGSFAVSIGVRNDDFRVDTTGSGQTRQSRGARDFGGDQAGAIAFAIADAIGDGAVTGVSAAVSNALRSSPDIERALQSALDVQALEEALEGFSDPIAAEFDELARIADDRLDLARQFGVDIVRVEELNAREREDLLELSLERQVGSLRRLLDDLDFGSLFEGTPAERRQALLGEIADAQQDIDAGVEGATDRLADLQRQLVETSRSAFGTAGGEFATDIATVRSDAERIIESERARIEEAAGLTQQQIDAQNETNDLLDGVNGRLEDILEAIRNGQPIPPVSPVGIPTSGGGGSFRSPFLNNVSLL